MLEILKLNRLILKTNIYTMKNTLSILFFSVILFSCSSIDENLTPLLITLQQEFETNDIGIKETTHKVSNKESYNSIGIDLVGGTLNSIVEEDINVSAGKMALMLYDSLNKDQLNKYNKIRIDIQTNDNTYTYLYNYQLLDKIKQGLKTIDKFYTSISNEDYEQTLLLFSPGHFKTNDKKQYLIDTYKQEIIDNGNISDYIFYGFKRDDNSNKYIIDMGCKKSLDNQYYLNSFKFNSDKQSFNLLDGHSL